MGLDDKLRNAAESVSGKAKETAGRAGDDERLEARCVQPIAHEAVLLALRVERSEQHDGVRHGGSLLG